MGERANAKVKMKGILFILSNAFFILGIYHAFSEGQIFGGFRRWFIRSGDVEFRITVLKPFIGCFVCMPSIWGTAAFLLFTPYDWFYFPIYVFMLSGLMYLIKLTFFE